MRQLAERLVAFCNFDVSYRSAGPSETPFQVATKLAGCYTKRYLPPRWSLALVKEPMWTDLAKEVEVLTFDPRVDQVRRVAEQREPTNIAMGDNFNTDKFEQAFGWRISGYRALFDENKSTLPPNLAIYMRTPLLAAQGPVVHVINSVGFAFDDERQPDYIYFTDGREAELLEHLKRVFLLVFACAKRKGLPTVVLCLLGGGAFSDYFKGGPDRYVARYFMPALNAAIAQLPSALRPRKLGLMGHPTDDEMAQLRIASNGIPCERYGFVPAICQQDGAEESLFMNAWDPHSIVGNGNAGDNSLDGFFGRASAIGYLSFPSVNRELTYVNPSELREFAPVENRASSSFNMIDEHNDSSLKIDGSNTVELSTGETITFSELYNQAVATGVPTASFIVPATGVSYSLVPRHGSVYQTRLDGLKERKMVPVVTTPEAAMPASKRRRK